MFNPEFVEIPFEFASKSQQVLKVLKQAVNFEQRAVSYNEIFEFAENNLNFKVDRRVIISSLQSLQKIGLVKVVERRHGNKRGGIYYLPSQLDIENYSLPLPDTILDCTRYVFEMLWTERCSQNESTNKYPKPLLTAEIQAQIEIKFPHILQEQKPGIVTVLLYQLATTNKSNIRCIKLAGTRQVCWAPSDVTNDNLDIERIYANDRIKLVKAVERACLRLKRPVNESDIKDEIRFD